MQESEFFDRRKIRFFPLAERKNRVRIVDDAVDPDGAPPRLETSVLKSIERVAQAVRHARAAGKPVICVFGAHAIKNGLGQLLADLAERQFITHLATNGAGVIHDWEFAHLGESSEDVRENAAAGRFGLWQETGFFINAAILAGAWRELGYGESVGALIGSNGLDIPPEAELLKAIAAGSENPEKAAAACDLLNAVRKFELRPGRMVVEHPYREYSLQHRAYCAKVPFTAHPMFGHDIIYTHPLCSGAAIGRTAERDFLRFAAAVSQIGEGGVCLSVGSAVMSPMIFEKAFSMSNNLAVAAGAPISGHRIFVVDMQPSTWDWRKGEPPEDNPAYYHRFMKSFSRMGGETEYVCADNRAFFLALRQMLLHCVRLETHTFEAP
jgi:hypothetical protein